ncbi:MAG: hypothetical protein ACTHON_09985 [Humibacter sp.]
MRPETLDDNELLDALRDMWMRLDPPPEDLDALAIQAIEQAELDDPIVLELMSEDFAFANVRGEGERTLRFEAGRYEVLLRIAREPEGYRIDGWSTPAAQGVVRIECDGHERVTDSDALGRFAFVGIGSGTATVSLTESPGAAPTWTTAAFTL